MIGVNFAPIVDVETGEVYSVSEMNRLIKFEVEIFEGFEFIEKI